MDGEVDVRSIPGLDQSQLARLADTVAVDVVPKPETRGVGPGPERVRQDVARIGTRGILTQRRRVALKAIRAECRNPVAAGHAVGESADEKFWRHGRPFD